MSAPTALCSPAASSRRRGHDVFSYFDAEALKDWHPTEGSRPLRNAVSGYPAIRDPCPSANTPLQGLLERLTRPLEDQMVLSRSRRSVALLGVAGILNKLKNLVRG